MALANGTMNPWFWILVGVTWLNWLVVVLVFASRAAATGDFAPGWRIRCVTCGRNRPAAEVGIIRLGGYGTKYTLVRCGSCERIRWAAIERKPVEPNNANTN